jgi:hypothetical protein
MQVSPSYAVTRTPQRTRPHYTFDRSPLHIGYAGKFAYLKKLWYNY